MPAREYEDLNCIFYFRIMPNTRQLAWLARTWCELTVEVEVIVDQGVYRGEFSKGHPVNCEVLVGGDRDQFLDERGHAASFLAETLHV